MDGFYLTCVPALLIKCVLEEGVGRDGRINDAWEVARFATVQSRRSGIDVDPGWQFLSVDLQEDLLDLAEERRSLDGNLRTCWLDKRLTSVGKLMLLRVVQTSINGEDILRSTSGRHIGGE